MNFLRTSAVLFLSCAAVATFGQTTSPAAGPSSSAAGASKTPVDLSGFKEQIEERNKALTDQVTSVKAIVKKNTVILQDARKIDADNKRLEAERKLLEAQNAEFARESQAMQSETTGVTVPPPPVAPVRVEPVVPVAPATPAAPAPVEPPPPPRVETAAAPTVAPIAPPRVEPPPPPRVEAVVAPAVARITPPRIAHAVAVSAPPAFAYVVVANAPAAVELESVVATQLIVPVRNLAPMTRPTAVKAPPAARVAVEAADGPIRVSSGVSQGLLLAPIVPVYPRIAVSAHVEGAVVMEAIISKDGSIASVHAVSGPAMLRDAALDAVRVAHYRPYRVDGQPIEVAATIKVIFQLAR